MLASLSEGNTLLAVDVGSATTRVIFFDVVEGHYRLIAIGQSPTTSEMPFRDIGEGVRQAIEKLEVVLSMQMLDSDHRLVIPAQPEVGGADAFVATLSVGLAVNTLVGGLFANVSLKSAQRLAGTTYTRITETLDLNDRRKPEEQIDSIIREQPDLIILAGGTDGGAFRSVKKIWEVIGLACYLLPRKKRPAVLYVGNQNLEKEVRSALEPLSSSFHFSPNIRPSLEVEDLEPARNELASIISEIRTQQMKGVDELRLWSGGCLLPSSYAQGRMVRFLNKIFRPRKGILAVDVGASAVTIAAGYGDKLTINVYPHLGLGENLPELLTHTNLDDIARWLPVEIQQESLRNYLYQKSLYPGSVPATTEDLAIEQSLAREALRLAFAAASTNFTPETCLPGSNPLPRFDYIFAGGSVITNAPTYGQSMLLMLDALQPVGITTLILDQYNLLPVLGAAAEKNLALLVHVIKSGVFINLATVVSPISTERDGTLNLNARLIYADGKEVTIEVKHGGLKILPLASGQLAQLELQPNNHTDVGFGPGRGGKVPVTGGAIGVVIDARGRPLRLRAEPFRRRELYKKWLEIVGG